MQISSNLEQIFAINAPINSALTISGNFSEFYGIYIRILNISLSSGACLIIQVNETTILCQFYQFPTQLGPLNVTFYGFTLSTLIQLKSTQIATIVPSPTITQSFQKLAMNADFLTIQGTEFDNVTIPTTTTITLSFAEGFPSPNCDNLTIISSTQIICSISLQGSGPLSSNINSFGGSSGNSIVSIIVGIYNYFHFTYILHKLRHPNIVQFFGVCSDEKNIYIVSELILTPNKIKQARKARPNPRAQYQLDTYPVKYPERKAGNVCKKFLNSKQKMKKKNTIQ